MAAQHLVLPAQVKNLEFQLQMWNSALQVGTLVTHCHLWVTGSNPELWLGFISAHSGLLNCQKSGFGLLGTCCLQLMS